MVEERLTNFLLQERNTLLENIEGVINTIIVKDLNRIGVALDDTMYGTAKFVRLTRSIEINEAAKEIYVDTHNRLQRIDNYANMKEFHSELDSRYINIKESLVDYDVVIKSTKIFSHSYLSLESAIEVDNTKKDILFQLKESINDIIREMDGIMRREADRAVVEDEVDNETNTTNLLEHLDLDNIPIEVEIIEEEPQVEKKKTTPKKKVVK